MLYVAEVSCVLRVELLLPLPSLENDVSRIHDNDVIPVEHVRGKAWFVLPMEDVGDVRSQAPKHLPCCVDKVPTWFCRLGNTRTHIG